MKPLFYVDHVGHRFAMCPVAHPTLERAIAHAKHSCGDAIQTRVWDCTMSNVGTLVLALNRDGSEVKSL